MKSPGSSRRSAGSPPCPWLAASSVDVTHACCGAGSFFTRGGFVREVAESASGDK